MHVPNPGFIWQQLLQREREPKGGGGASLSPSPRSRAVTSFGGKGWWPKQRSRQRGGAWYFCPPWMPRASKPASGVSAAAAEWGGQDPPGLRNGLSGGGGREWSPLRCAAPAGCAWRPARPPWCELLGRPPAPSVLSSPFRLAFHCPGTKRDYSPGSRGAQRPCLGSPFVHFAPLDEGPDFALAAASLAGAASGRPDREIPAVAMAPGTCCGGRSPAAPGPGCAASPLRGRREGTSRLSSPARPPLGATK